MLKITLANGPCFSAIAEVVVAIGKTETSLIDPGDLSGGIVKVGPGPDAKYDGVARELELKMRDQRSQIPPVLDFVNCFEFGLNCGNAATMNGWFIHARRVKIANLSRYLIALPGASCLLQKAAKKTEVGFIHLVGDVPGDLIGRNRVLFLPAAACIAVKVLARIDGIVDRSQIEARGVCHRRPTLPESTRA